MSAPSQAHARAIHPSTGWTRTPTSIYAVRRDLAHAEKGMLFLIDRFTRGFQRPWAPISVKMAMRELQRLLSWEGDGITGRPGSPGALSTLSTRRGFPNSQSGTG